MKKIIGTSMYLLMMVAVLVWSCGGDSDTGNNSTTENNDASNATVDKTETNDTKQESNVKTIVGSFVDASPLDQTFYYFFETDDKQEIAIMHNTTENTTLKMAFDLVDATLKPNPEYVGKKFKVTYTEEERMNDNTGDTEMMKIPSKIEIVK